MSTTQNAAPTVAEWRKLYELAARVKELAPWEWMMEDEVFGVRDDEAGVTGFISVMGAGGEHFAIALYPDPAALYAFLDLHDQGTAGEADDSPHSAMSVLELPQMQVAFEDNDQLNKEDKVLIKKLGLKFRGAKAWPQFRSYAPGLFPWYLTGAEVRRLTVALGQLLQVAPRYRDDEELLAPSEDGTVFLVRVPKEQGGWEDQILKIEEPEPAPLHFEVDPQAFAQAKELPRVTNVLEIELAMLPSPVKDKKIERPFFPYLLTLAEAQSGRIVGNEMLQPMPSQDAMYAKVPQSLLGTFLRLGVLPELVRVRNPLLAELLAPLAAELGFKVDAVRRLPAIDEFMDGMGQMLGRF